MANDKWQLDLGEYIRQGEPEKAEKSKAWQTAIGLQDVDGLKTSEYLLETAKEHIEGKIDIDAAQRRISSYYEQRDTRREIEADTREADIVSARITALLSENTFQFSPAALQTIHRRLFTDVFDHAGQYRTCNISKKEWVLNGESVLYASYDSIRETLQYDFDMEKQFSYGSVSMEDAVKHIAKFIAGIWQIHPFCEGNMRTTAVFTLKYLQSFGFTVNNDAFAENSWYFRNALVRANYSNLKKNIAATTSYLEGFFENLLLGAQHELKNRYLHVDYLSIHDAKYQNDPLNTVKNDTLKPDFQDVVILKILSANPRATQTEIAKRSGVSVPTVKRHMKELQEKGVLARMNGKRDGFWKVLQEDFIQ